MWPWGHLALGYALYSLALRARTRSSPDSWNAAALVAGTQFPDLVDKPLAWWFGVLPGGRTLGHSLLFALPLVLALAVVTRRRGRGSLATAFGVGYATHLAGDGLFPVVAGNYRALAFLLWPATPTVVYDTEPSVVWHLSTIDPSPVFLLELALVGAVALLWVVDGAPVVSGLIAYFRRERSRQSG